MKISQNAIYRFDENRRSGPNRSKGTVKDKLKSGTGLGSGVPGPGHEVSC